MIRNSSKIDEILSVITEAKNRNYPDFVLRADLDRVIQSIRDEYKEYEYTDNDIEWARDEAFDDGREEGYSEGYEDAEKEAGRDTKNQIVNYMAEEITKWKETWLEVTPESDLVHINQVKEKLNELIINIDEGCYKY